MATDFASFAAYREYIHLQANTALSKVQPSDKIADEVECFVSEWLDICGHNETMFPVIVDGWGGGDGGRFCVQIWAGTGKRPHSYPVRTYFFNEDNALSCWIKVSFALKMAPVMSDDKTTTITNVKYKFCDEWARLQHVNKETREIDFRSPRQILGTIRRSDYIMARDITTLSQTRDLLWPTVELHDNMLIEAMMLWESGTDARRRLDYACTSPQ